MSHFNLVDEHWIPVRFLVGGRGEVGIREALLRSREIAAIEDPSPLVVASLHRFLLAVLYRALEGPTDVEQAKALFGTGIPTKPVAAYLGEWRGRFWLFDEKFPFYQIPAYEPRESKGKVEWKTWPVIAAEHNAGNAKVLFDHVEIGAAGSIPSRTAACWLIACQTFALGGGNSEFRYTRNAPSATAVMTIPQGQSLHDSLLLSLVPENREVLRSDLPVWEQEPVSLEALRAGFTRPVTGIADLYTWLSRSVRFNLVEDGGSLRELVFASGISVAPNGCVDPMLCFRVDPSRGRVPIQFRERGLWREFDSLLPDASGLAPRVIEHASRLGRAYPGRAPHSVMVLGQSNDQAKVEYWRLERYALPRALLGNVDLRTEIRGVLAEAEGAHKSLWFACRSFARDTLSRGGRDPAPKDITRFVEGLPVSRCYWSTLESTFHELLHAYTREQDSEDIKCEWLKSVRAAMRLAWDQHRASVATGDAWAIRALMRAEWQVSSGLRKLDARIAQLAPQMEDT